MADWRTQEKNPMLLRIESIAFLYLAVTIVLLYRMLVKRSRLCTGRPVLDVCMGLLCQYGDKAE